MVNKILTAIFSVIKKFLIWFLSFINIPSFPDFVESIFNTLIGYVAQGMSFIACFVDMEVIRGCLLMVVALFSFEYVFGLFLWLYRVIRGNY